MNSGSVTLLNEPKFSEHERDREFNETRKMLVPKVADFIAQHEMFRDVQVNVTFVHAGISSLVSILDTPNEKYVLKIPLDPIRPPHEGIFLKAWESVGVNVPHVLEEGLIGDHHYLLMEYIDSLTISKSYSIDEILEKELYKEMGSTLRKMHTAKSDGYGEMREGKGEYTDFSAFLENDTKTNDKIEYVKRHEILNDSDHGSTHEAREVLVLIIGTSTESSYCHNDFHIGNVFSTSPLTVFDPIPVLNHPYMDLARSIVLAVRMGLRPVSDQLISGYFDGEEYNQQLLQACIVLNVYMKFRYWHQTDRMEDIEKVKKYLAETKHLLKNP